MKKNSLLFVLIFFAGVSFSQKKVKSNEDTKYTILLTGASFAAPGNGWFEMGCHELKAKPINRAIGGEAISNTANRMIGGTLYSPEEFDKIDALVIMQVHEKDVFNETGLKENYTDYKTPLDNSDYAVCYDYVIKRYVSDCYNQKFNPKSKYYNLQYGKPAIIVLSTSWNDSRPIFNTSVRKLAEKWGVPVIEFDKNIGFSRNVLHPVTKEQFSLIFSNDTQEMHGEKYGWHALQGENSYIQQRMAAIFVDTMRKILPLKR